MGSQCCSAERPRTEAGSRPFRAEPELVRTGSRPIALHTSQERPPRLKCDCERNHRLVYKNAPSGQYRKQRLFRPDSCTQCIGDSGQVDRWCMYISHKPKQKPNPNPEPKPRLNPSTILSTYPSTHYPLSELTFHKTHVYSVQVATILTSRKNTYTNNISSFKKTILTVTKQ